MGLFDILRGKKTYEYKIPLSEVDKTGMELELEDWELTDDAEYVHRIKQTKKERRAFENMADANQREFKDIPRYTFKCGMCKKLYPLTQLKNYTFLNPHRIDSVCKHCK